MIEDLSVSPIFDAEFVRLVRISKYYQLASILILLYDFLITLDLEIENIWSRFSLSAGRILFILNRYFPLISYLWIIAAYHQSSWQSPACSMFLHFPLVMTTISDGVISIIVILRLYAVYMSARWVPITLGGLVLVLMGLEIWATTGVTLVPSHVGVNGCIITAKDDSYLTFALLWGMNVIFDGTVFFMTVWKTRRKQFALRASGRRIGLRSLLLRDGTIYFAVMFSAKVINFVVFWVMTDIKDLITINWTFNHTITVIMISRLVLNVHAEVNERPQGSITRTPLKYASRDSNPCPED